MTYIYSHLNSRTSRDEKHNNNLQFAKPTEYFLTVMEGGRREGWRAEESVFLVLCMCKERKVVRCRVRLGMWVVMQIHFQRHTFQIHFKDTVQSHNSLKLVGNVWLNSMVHRNLRGKSLAINCDVISFESLMRGKIAFGGQGICIAHFFCRCLIGSDTGFIRIHSRL